jgi:hypothetical protein
MTRSVGAVKPLWARRLQQRPAVALRGTDFVYVADGELKTDHSFSLAGRCFLTLHYEVEHLGTA